MARKICMFQREASAAEIQLESASEANIIFMHDFLSDLFGLLCVACVLRVLCMKNDSKTQPHTASALRVRAVRSVNDKLICYECRLLK